MEFNSAIAKLEQIVGDRAFVKGGQAFRDGRERHAPAVFGVYSGRWVAGYDDAATSVGCTRDADEDVMSE